MRIMSLFWAARSWCSEGADIADALSILGAEAKAAGLDKDEATATIRSAYRM